MILAVFAASQDEEVELTISQAAPTIDDIYAATCTPVANQTGTPCLVTIEVSDQNGNSDINVSATYIQITRATEATRFNGPCSSVVVDADTLNITCNVSISFFDEPGNWNINATAYDNSVNSDNLLTAGDPGNDAVSMQNVDAIFTPLSRILFINKSTGVSNQESDTPLAVTNLGNQLYANITVTGYQLNESGNLDIISAANFSVNNITASATGEVQLIDATPVQKVGLQLIKGEELTPYENETLYFYVDLSAGLTSGTYRENQNWTVTLSTS